MELFVDQFSRHEWKEYSEQFHSICFGKFKPKEWDRIDFALVVRNTKDLLGYVTCREIDAETVYWQFGGSFPGTKNTIFSWEGYKKFVEFCQGKYKRIITYIENTNMVMLKMAMKIGFKIIGTRNIHNSILLEHVLELK